LEPFWEPNSSDFITAASLCQGVSVLGLPALRATKIVILSRYALAVNKEINGQIWNWC
jgi:hypothetical protein